jgi:hypothetical protein
MKGSRARRQWSLTPLIPWILALALGCADFESSVDPTGGAPDELVTNPSFATHIAPIFDKRCAQGGCHSVATQQAGLVLTPEAAYDALVGVPATLGAGQLRVLPTKPDSSWLVAMIGPDAAARRNLSRMPLATHPLTENQITNIVRWIQQGALRN